MPYSLDQIKDALSRAYGISIGKPKLKVLLEAPMWVPEAGRMVAVGNNLANLDTSTHYGVFKKVTDGFYEIESNRASLWKYARLLTPEEIAKCF